MDQLMPKSSTIIITYPAKNKVYNIEIDPNAKVQELIQEFQEIVQPNAHETVSLRFNGQTLKPKLSLREQGVQKGSNLDLIVQTQGG